MDTQTTVTTALKAGPWSATYGRGDVLRIHHNDGRIEETRVTNVSTHTITIRRAHRWRWLEWVHRQYEQHIKWPLQSSLRRLRATPPPPAAPGRG